MDIVNQDSKLAEIVRKDFMLFSVLKRLGIDIAYRELTVKQACNLKNIDINLFLVVVNSFVNPQYTPNNESLCFPTKDLMNYLSKTHNLFRDEYIPIMRDLFKSIRELDPDCGVIFVNDVYIKAQTMFIEHNTYEDEFVYPYIIDVCENGKTDVNQEFMDFINLSEPAHHMKFVEEMDDLLNIFLKYVRPTCQSEMFKLVAVLTSFSKELANHMLVEDKFFYPRIKKLVHG